MNIDTQNQPIKKKRKSSKTAIQRKEKILSKDVEVAQAKALKEIGFSNRKIARILSRDNNTIAKWVKLDNEQIAKIKEVIGKHLMAQDWQLTQVALEEINNHLKDKKRLNKTKLWELTGLYKVSRDMLTPKVSGNSGNSVAIQVNIDKDSFSIDEVKSPNL